jgi:hypothetical protein
MYYQYYFYSRQGIPGAGLPMPVLGGLYELYKLNKRVHELKQSVVEEYWTSRFGYETLPGVI